MIWFVALAFAGGLLVSLSRQINGRLALSTSAMESSFWNHAVGFGALTLAAFLFAPLFPPDPGQIPWWAWFGGVVGVIFIAASSWLIGRIGAAMTASMIIAGQMVAGLLLDIAAEAPGVMWMRIMGVALIFAGVLTYRRS